MKIGKCTLQHKASMIAMPASSTSQNQSLKEELETGNLSLEQCIIAVKDDCVVARIVIEKEIKHLSYITIEDITKEEVTAFVAYTIQQLPRDIEWSCSLYSDKTHYQVLREVLQANFDIDIHKESYTRKTEPLDLGDVHFEKAAQMERSALLKLMMNASNTTLDRSIQHEQTVLSLETAMSTMMDELLHDKESDDLFQILWIAQKPVGFIAVTRLLDAIGGISYIGVDPNYQGHHYGTLLLKKAIAMSYHHTIHKLIGDIDEENFPMRHHLLQCGFHKDCKEHIFILTNQ